MRDITIRQLEYLTALRQLGHFRKAAEQCAVSQPGLSAQLKKLEETLSITLFERTNRHVRITPVGEQLAELAADILQKIEEFEQVARQAQGDLIGPLRIGIIPSMAPYLIRHVLTELKAAFPDCEPNVHEAVTQTLIGGIHSGEIDVAIMAIPADDPQLEEFALFDDHFLLATEKNALGVQSHIQPGHVDFSNLLLLEEGHCLRDQALEVCSFVDKQHLRRFNVSSLYTLMQMVSSGMGQTLLPTMALQQEGSLPNISLYRFAPPEPFRTVGLVWRKKSARSEEFRKLGGVIVKGRIA